MLSTGTTPRDTKIDRLEARLRETTHGRIRDLSVTERGGCLIVEGRVPSHHTKQLALHATLEFLNRDDRFQDRIVVGLAGPQRDAG